MIGHPKSDNRMERCLLPAALGDALHALSCAAGYNIRRLMRAIVRRAARRLSLPSIGVGPYGRISLTGAGRATLGVIAALRQAIGRLLSFRESPPAQAAHVG